jgi:proline iminopeptidase
MAFFERRDQLLEDIDRIRHIPAVIVQGRYDIVCPPSTAWALHKAWPEADFQLIPDAGHSAFDPANASALVAATGSVCSRVAIRHLRVTRGPMHIISSPR